MNVRQIISAHDQNETFVRSVAEISSEKLLDTDKVRMYVRNEGSHRVLPAEGSERTFPTIGDTMSAVAVGVPQFHGFTRQAASQSTERLHLTRRGRIVVGIAIALPLLFGAYLLGAGATQADAEVNVTTVSFDYITVAMGDTLWSIASDIAPTADAQQVIDDIVVLNQLESSVVQPGQRLAIPVKYSN